MSPQFLHPHVTNQITNGHPITQPLIITFQISDSKKGEKARNNIRTDILNVNMSRHQTRNYHKIL